MCGPRLPFRVAQRPTYRPVPVDPVALRDPRTAQATEIARTLVEFAPDVLLVDLFWAPLVHILPLLRCEAWLLLRKVPPIWLQGPPGVPFSARPFARIVAIEPGATESAATDAIDPIVITNPDELRPPGALREALGLPPNEPLAVVHQAGGLGELESLTRQAGSRARTFTLERVDAAGGDDRFFPLCEWLGDADALFAGAGYNAFWEARWLGHAARTTFRAFPRKIDDQAWRLKTCWAHTPTENGADVLAQWLTG